MADLTPKKMQRIALSISIALHVLLLSIPACTQKMKILDTPNTYSVPVKLNVSKKTETPKVIPKQTPAPQNIKKAVSKKGIAQKKKKEPEKPRPPQAQPGDSERPLVHSSREPVSPKIAINNEWEGTIIVDALISPEGTLISYKIKQSTGHNDLDEAFIRTLESTYTFKPRQIFGKKQTGTVSISYTFKL
jgi:TonB family protein